MAEEALVSSIRAMSRGAPQSFFQTEGGVSAYERSVTNSVGTFD
jgi:hypothetical protein